LCLKSRHEKRKKEERPREQSKKQMTIISNGDRPHHGEGKEQKVKSKTMEKKKIMSSKR
jgi:hypothetical protein